MKSLTRRTLVLAAGTAAAASLAIPTLADSLPGSDPVASELQLAAATPASGKVAETRAALRDLWVGHIFWVRSVVFATFAKNGPAAKAAEQAVVGDAKDIAGAIAPFY